MTVTQVNWTIVSNPKFSERAVPVRRSEGRDSAANKRRRRVFDLSVESDLHGTMADYIHWVFLTHNPVECSAIDIALDI